MNKIFKYVVIAAAAFALIACEKTPQETGKEPEKPGNEIPKEEIEYTEDIEFVIEQKSVNANSAQFTITHNGTDDDTWYAFATLSSNVNLSIENMVEELTADGGKVTGLSSGTEKTITLENLDGDTKYTFIVFAITEDGDLYGSHNYVRFTTPISFGPNPAWTVEYTGRGFIGEYEYEHTVTVTSTDSNPYFMTIVTKERYENTNIRTLLNEELKAFTDFIQSYNNHYGIESTVADWSYTESAIDAFGIDLGYTYVAMAIGVTAKGDLTGLYAVSEEFEPYEEEMTPEYASWLGTWTMTGANGVSFDVTFTKDKSNTSYIMTGWETDDFDVIVDWYPSDNFWILWSQFIGTYTSAGYGDFDLYFAPANYVEDGQEVYTTDGLPICIGCDLPSGEKVITGYAEDDKTLYTHMRFAGVWYDGVGGITATTDFPTFPLTVSPCASTFSAPSELATVSRKAVNIVPPARFELYRF
ncbi:MAG: hypothetical protein IKY48_05625 [Bacteroidales bacterium]|nr:hypothetical protein [Bacteroidales bacterium]